MYYQIRIKANGVRGSIYDLDKTDKKEILEEILLPYLKGEEFRVDGHILKENNIKRFIVKTSEVTSKNYVDITSLESPVEMLDMIFPESILDSNYSTDITNKIIKEAKQIIDESKKKEDKIMNVPKIKDSKTNNNKVFIVHGHDEKLLKEVKSFLLALRLDPIILREQVSQGKTVIEKLEEYTDVSAGITLFTACDEGAKKGEKPKSRSRQNVVIEHGFLMGKIGRKNVIPIVENGIELPGDINGAVYISSSQWKAIVGKELIALGCKIDPMHLLKEL